MPPTLAESCYHQKVTLKKLPNLYNSLFVAGNSMIISIFDSVLIGFPSKSDPQKVAPLPGPPQIAIHPTQTTVSVNSPQCGRGASWPGWGATQHSRVMCPFPPSIGPRTCARASVRPAERGRGRARGRHWLSASQTRFVLVGIRSKSHSQKVNASPSSISI